jgi:hypothetical protein
MPERSAVRTLLSLGDGGQPALQGEEQTPPRVTPTGVAVRS